MIMQGVERSNHHLVSDHDATSMDLDDGEPAPAQEIYRSDLMTVRPTPTAGLGVFSTAPIPAGTRLISESPLLILSTLADPSDLYAHLTSLPSSVTAPCWALAASTPRRQDTQHMPGLRARYTGPSHAFEAHCDAALQAWHIYETNRFTVRSSGASERDDSLGVFPRAARLNHGCRPNVFHRHSWRTGRLTVHALRDIRPGVELVTSYIDVVHPTPERRRVLAHWGFRCGCALCRDGEPASEQRRGKLEGRFSKVRREAADREGRRLEPRVYERAMGELGDVLRLMDEEGLDECDTSAVALGLAAECARMLGRRDLAIDLARRALEVEERCLGTDSGEWEIARQRLREVEAMEMEVDAVNSNEVID